MWIDTGKSNIIISQLIGKIRDKETDAASFRSYLKKLGCFLAYECSKFFDSEKCSVETPLGKAEYNKVKSKIVVISILRAALPMAEGVLEVLPESAFGVISASRGVKLKEDGSDFRIDCTYLNIPYIEEKIVIVVDPMLASGSTLAYVLEQIKNQKPSKIIVLCAISSIFGVQRLLKLHPGTIILTGAIDEKLNEKGYIVPGLGDAGDRAFNT
ncbi:MAG: uracil phosphoribosyltransferase [Candidatus Heimdallarchaeaceae archaeon]